MSVKVPPGLAWTLLFAGTLLLAGSVYLEIYQLDLLEKHPILVNLLSGAVAFCFGVLMVSAVLVRVQDASQKTQSEKDLAEAVDGMLRLLRDIGNDPAIIEAWPRVHANCIELYEKLDIPYYPLHRTAFLLPSFPRRIHMAVESAGSRLVEELSGCTGVTRELRLVQADLDGLIRDESVSSCVDTLWSMTKLIRAARDHLHRTTPAG